MAKKAKIRSAFEVLDSLRTVAAIKGNIVKRRNAGTMRRGDKTRLLLFTRSLRRLKEEYRQAKWREAS